MRRDLRFLLTQLLDLLPDHFERANRVVTAGRQPLLVPDQGLEPLLEIHEAQAYALFDVLLLFFLEPLGVCTELLQACAFDLDRAFGRGELFAAALPAFTPLLHRAFRVLERVLRAALIRVRLLEVGSELAQYLIELRQLELILLDVRVDLGDLRFGALQVLGLALNQLFAVLNRLLEARDFRANTVVVALHGAETLVAVRELDPQFLDRGFGRALRGDGCFEGDLLL